VFDRAPVVILMLANAAAIDTVLGRGTPQFAHMLAGRTVIHMGTTSPGQSQALAADLATPAAATWKLPSPGRERRRRPVSWWRCLPATTTRGGQ
jgi:3-hydroxyisobutyrate dehydrogenase